MDFISILVIVILAIFFILLTIISFYDPDYETDNDDVQVKIEELDFEGSRDYNRYRGIKAVFKRAYKSKDDK